MCRTATVTLLVLFILGLPSPRAGAQIPMLPMLTATPLTEETVASFQGCSFACASDWSTRVSSALPPQGANRYDARQLGDGDGRTAWASRGKGEWLEVRFTGKATDARWEAPLRGFRLVNGYTKSREAWKRNSRVRTLRLDWNGAPCYRITLRDTPAVQSVAFPATMVRKGDRLRLTIVEVYPGTRSKDTCISEIVFDGAH